MFVIYITVHHYVIKPLGWGAPLGHNWTIVITNLYVPVEYNSLWRVFCWLHANIFVTTVTYQLNFRYVNFFEFSKEDVVFTIIVGNVSVARYAILPATLGFVMIHSKNHSGKGLIKIKNINLIWGYCNSFSFELTTSQSNYEFMIMTLYSAHR